MLPLFVLYLGLRDLSQELKNSWNLFHCSNFHPKRDILTPKSFRRRRRTRLESSRRRNERMVKRKCRIYTSRCYQRQQKLPVNRLEGCLTLSDWFVSGAREEVAARTQQRVWQTRKQTTWAICCQVGTMLVSRLETLRLFFFPWSESQHNCDIAP